MNALLFSMPGAPVLYYGDEIGMGDNVYLGDRQCSGAVTATGDSPGPIREVSYDLNNRPDWVLVPLISIIRLIGDEG